MSANLEAFATVSELEAIWRDLDTTESNRADVLLLQASNYLRQVATNVGKDLDDLALSDPTKVLEANIKMVVLNAVQRAMSTPTEVPADASQWSQSATPYSESMSFSGAESTSTIYFKKRELDLLGIGTGGKSKISVLRGVR